MTFTEFWPFYLSVHPHRETKIIHTLGLMLAYFLGVCAVVRAEWWFLITVPMAAYGPAFCAHFFIEQNKPASFKHPLLSILADHRMAWMILTGREI